MAHHPELWKKAKKRCRLNEDDIRIAKEMGLNPKSLIKKHPESDGTVEGARQGVALGYLRKTHGEDAPCSEESVEAAT